MAKDTFLNLPADKRQQIEDLAMEEFARHSFGRASLSNIVKRAGIAKGSIYQYFDNKLGLYRWLVEAAAKKKLSYIKQPSPEPGGFLVWLEEALLGGLRFASEHPRIARLSAQMREGGDPTLAPIARKLRKAGLVYMEQLVREAQLHGEIRDELEPQMVAIYIGAVQNSIFDALAAKAGLASFEELLDDQGIGRFSEDELRKIVHPLMEIVRRGASSEAVGHPVAGVKPVQFDVNETIKEVFGGSDE